MFKNILFLIFCNEKSDKLHDLSLYYTPSIINFTKFIQKVTTQSWVHKAYGFSEKLLL